MNGFMKYIKGLLEETEELVPEPTGLKPKMERLDDIQVVIFDVYGTLLISSSGDVEEEQLSEQHLLHALEEGHFVVTDKKAFFENGQARKMLTQYKELINEFQIKKKKEKNINYPEINIVAIWDLLLKQAAENNIIEFTKNSDVKKMIFVFEMHSNKVYPMPGMNHVLGEMIKENKILGIISNAQFYTPIIMNYFINKKIELNDLHPFDKRLTLFSYQESLAKPEFILFDKLLSVLRNNYQLKASQTLFVGNDMHKDIYPAHKAGMKTALFAGDKRSLRLRQDKPETKNLEPDLIITELSQLLNVI